jgi:hypothetical protein
MEASSTQYRLEVNPRRCIRETAEDEHPKPFDEAEGPRLEAEG